tara:strand:+ start:2632 stop:4527 length:1896 start_codon:yes stop_codon:yes gene_type:complete
MNSRLTLWLVNICLIFGIPVVFAEEAAQPLPFEQSQVIATWEKYEGILTFGRNQTLALIDDGCNLSRPEWSSDINDDYPKVLVTYDSVDGDDDPRHEGRGYHGTTIGIPSSVNHEGKRGVAFNNQVAVIRSLECCHCNVKDSKTLAQALAWVAKHHRKYRITTVNLAPVDDLAHDEPVPTEIDAQLAKLRKLGIWVSAPTGNHNFTNGISWPSSQPNCFAIGAVRPGTNTIYLDRHKKVDLVVPAGATSSSNAILCGAAMILREAIDVSGFKWREIDDNLPQSMMRIFQNTGQSLKDDATGLLLKRLDLLAAVDFVFEKSAQKSKSSSDQKPVATDGALLKSSSEAPEYFGNKNYDQKWKSVLKTGIDTTREYLGNYGPTNVYIIGQEEDELAEASVAEKIIKDYCKCRHPNNKDNYEHCLKRNGASLIERAKDGSTEAYLSYVDFTESPLAELVFINPHGFPMPYLYTRGIHEYTHVFQRSYPQTPTWMTEGGAEFIAFYLGGQHEWVNFQDSMRQSMRMVQSVDPTEATIIDFEDIGAIERDRPELKKYYRHLAYDAGVWGVAYLIHSSSTRKVRHYTTRFYPMIAKLGWKDAIVQYTSFETVEGFYESLQEFFGKPIGEQMRLLEELR